MAKKNLAASCLVVNQWSSYMNIIGLNSVGFINYQDICRMFNQWFGSLQQQDATGPIMLENLTSNDVNVSFLQFNLSGASQNEIPNLQPRVTIVMTIKKAGAAKPEIKIQTTISQRNLDTVQ